MIYKVTNFPNELLFIIQEFLFAKDWCFFMSMTKQFTTLKRDSLIVELKRSFCSLFYSSDEFREKIIRQLRNSRNQINVIGEFLPATTDINKYPDIHSLVLNSFSGTFTSDLFVNLHTLRLIRCRIEDVSMLSHIKVLEISYNEFLVDVSPLKNIEHLTLQNCSSLREIGALGNHQYLDLSYCAKITTVNHLAKAHTLILKDCMSISDVSDWGNAILWICLIVPKSWL
jgi:hypothetical protein